MFKFSEPHDSEGDDNVRQIIVFTCDETKQMFEDEFAKRVAEHGVANTRVIGIGAIFLLRAVKSSDGKFLPTIRCAMTSGMLWQSSVGEVDSNVALIMAMKELTGSMISDIDEYVFNIPVLAQALKTIEH